MIRVVTALVLCLFLLQFAVHADGLDEHLAIGKHNADQVLQQVVPKEFDAFKRAAEKGYNRTTADAVFAMVKQAKVEWAKYPNRNEQDDRKRFLAAMAYTFAWGKAIGTREKTDDKATRTSIISAWNSALTKEHSLVGDQLRSLYYQWNPAFMTDQAMSLFKTSTDTEVIGGFTSIFGQYGKLKEEKLLQDKLSLLTSQMDTASVEYEVNALNIKDALDKIGYWKQGDKDRTGPPQPVIRAKPVQ